MVWRGRHCRGWLVRGKRLGRGVGIRRHRKICGLGRERRGAHWGRSISRALLRACRVHHPCGPLGHLGIARWRLLGKGLCLWYLLWLVEQALNPIQFSLLWRS